MPRSKPIDNSDSATTGITGIKIKGYKSIYRETRIGIRRLTILAGANNSGKSSIVQPVLMLKQTMETPYDPGALHIAGPNVLFTSLDQILSKIPGKGAAQQIHISLEWDRLNQSYLVFERDAEETISIRKAFYQISGEDFVLERRMSSAQIQNIGAQMAGPLQRIFDDLDEKPEYRLRRSRCFLGIEIFGESFPSLLTAPIGQVQNHITSIVHVPGLRGNPERTYKTSSVGPNFPGLFTDYVASILAEWKKTGDIRLSMTGKHLERLGLTWKVDTKPVDDTRVEVRVGRMPKAKRGGARDLVNIADVGFGVSQTLPVIVALQASRPGELVYIEQPELHLHPRAQMALATILVDAANRGVRVVVETHSWPILLAIQSAVAEGELDSERTQLHWFSRDGQTGETIVSSAELDRAGSFGDWPVDFGDAALEAQSRYLDAAEKQLLASA